MTGDSVTPRSRRCARWTSCRSPTCVISACRTGWAISRTPTFPGYFAEYARAFAARYPWVQLYTPVNEILIAAKFSAKYGWWNERLRSDAAFVTAIKHLCQANLLAMRAIQETRPDAVFVQSETIEYFHAEDPSCFARCRLLNETRFLPLDLTYGRPVAPLM